MEDHEKKEEIATALSALVGVGKGAPLILHGYFIELVGALTQQAIVAKCTLEHYAPILSGLSPYTEIEMKDDDGEYHSMSFEGLQGREGKGLCIILSLEKE